MLCSGGLAELRIGLRSGARRSNTYNLGCCVNICPASPTSFIFTCWIEGICYGIVLWGLAFALPFSLFTKDRYWTDTENTVRWTMRARTRVQPNDLLLRR